MKMDFTSYVFTVSPDQKCPNCGSSDDIIEWMVDICVETAELSGRKKVSFKLTSQNIQQIDLHTYIYIL